MSNNKQSIKIYTEEQVRDAINVARFYTEQFMPNDTIVDMLKPIQLPSDEEIEQYLKSFPYTKHLDDGQYNDGKIVGAELAIQWFRNKIQGTNK